MLEVDDVRLTQRTGELVLRHGKGDRRRPVPLNRTVRAALRGRLVDRAAQHSRPSVTGGSLWISRTGEQLSVRSIS
jgi:site-specific recombinase XerC